MLTNQLDEIQVTLPNDATSLSEPTDAELLMQFKRHRQEDAFEQLVAKHASMVMGVCGQILRNQHDAEDAFQATFLMLAQRAHKIQRASSVGGWLQRVAYRMALTIAKKRNRRRELPLHEAESNQQEHWLEITKQEEQAALHEELSQLPERFRDAITLCYLEGRTRQQAADELECTDAAIKGRLADGKRMLRMKLARRGFMLSAALTMATLNTSVCHAASLPLLVTQTVDICAATVLHGSTEVLSTSIRSLAQEGMKSMKTTLLTRSVVASVFLFGIGLAWATAQSDSVKIPEDATIAVEIDPPVFDNTLLSPDETSIVVTQETDSDTAEEILNNAFGENRNILMGTTQAWRIENPDGGAGRLDSPDKYKRSSDSVNVDAEIVARLATALRPYLLGGFRQEGGLQKRCLPRYGVLTRSTIEDNKIEVLYCFECDMLEVHVNGELVGIADFDRSSETLANIMKEVFPDDEAIQGL